MKKIAFFVLGVGLATPIAWADLTPIGDPVFGESMTQSASGGISAFMCYGHRVTAPTGLDGGYIMSVTGLGAFNFGSYESRNHPGGVPGPELVEGVWYIDGHNSFTVEFEIGDATTPPVGPGDYVGLRIENAAADGAGNIGISREWVFTNGVDPSLVSPPISGPIDGGLWTKWTGGWYLSDLHWDGGAWAGGQIPAPGAALLAMMGLGLVGWVKKRRRA